MPSMKTPRSTSPRARKSPKRLATRTYPILEFDPSQIAIIEPRRVHKPINAPKHCVLCFFQDVIDDLVRNGARVIHTASWHPANHPIYELEINANRLPAIHPRGRASPSPPLHAILS